MELDVLHKSQNPYIVEFYGAFFIETCVYLCMEYMDAGSLDKLYQIGVPEDVLSTITLSVWPISACVTHTQLFFVFFGTQLLRYSELANVNSSYFFSTFAY